MPDSSGIKIFKSPRILVAPLDWGLGHTTRCIPVIYALLSRQAEVWLAGEGPQEVILRSEFPRLPFLQLPGYRIRYGRSGHGFLPALLKQTPAILRSMRREKDWLKRHITLHEFDAVISDNRYGLVDSRIRSILITHQLRIKSPLGDWAEPLIQKQNYRLINRFSECWVPDEEDDAGFAGDLSHPVKRPEIPVFYTGILSRLKKSGLPENKDHLLIILSGPEPQRSILEKKMMEQLRDYSGSVTLIRGLPESSEVIPSFNRIRIYNHLPSQQLEKEMNDAGVVISRSGYSTIMDIMQVGKKSILIPTPGQTEQEYLGQFLHQNGIALCISQKEFNLVTALQQAAAFSYREKKAENSRLPTLIHSLLSRLKPAEGQEQPSD